MVCWTTDSAVSRPIMPIAATAQAQSLSASGCGAWSVATASMVPSASASRSASTSVSVRSGGLTLKTGLPERTISSVSSRWCGVTSAVTGQPCDFAQRTIRTEPAVERWQTCSRAPMCEASSTSRAMIASSATAGQPPRPSSAETAPSFIWAPSVSRGSWACWATTPSIVLTYSSARRISTASSTHLPSSEKTRTAADEPCIASSSASCLPSRPTLTAPTGCTSQ